MRTLAAIALLALLTWPASQAAAPDASYEGRTYAALTPAAGVVVGDSSAASAVPFREHTSHGTVGDAPVTATAARGEFVGEGGRSFARISSAVVRVELPTGVLEAHGVEAEALAGCEGSWSRSRVDHLRYGGLVLHPTSGQRLALPGGLAVVLDEAHGSRSAAVAEQATNALRVLDHRGQTLAVVGHAEARAFGCVRLDEGACGAFVPLSHAVARLGDAGPGGDEELLVAPPEGDAAGADFAWQNGVWTRLRLDHDAVRRQATLTLRGATSVTGPVVGIAPHAVLLLADADGARIDVEEVQVQDLPRPGRLTVQDGQGAWTLASPLLEDGFSLDLDVRLTWDPADPPAPGALGLRLLTGRCG